MEGTSSCYDSTTGQVYGSISGSGCTTCWSTEEDEEIIEEAAEVPSCGYHHCGETFDVFEAYELGWQNFGQAWGIYWNPNARYGQRFVAGAYMGAWSGGHLAGITGIAILSWRALVVGLTQYYTKNPDAARVSLGNYPEYIRKGYTYLDGGRLGNFLDSIGIWKPINVQFMQNQIAQLKPMEISIARDVGRYTFMEMQMLQNSNQYFLYTQTNFVNIVHFFEPWVR
jgi:hypothetical protein